MVRHAPCFWKWRLSGLHGTDIFTKLSKDYNGIYCYYFLSPIEELYLLWEKKGVISRKVMNLHYETLANIGNDVAIDSCSMLDF